MQSKFNLPDNNLVDTTQCTDEKPCKFCEVSIEFANAKLTDEIEKESKVKKRTFARQKFFNKRLIEGHNDVHRSPLFYKKKLIEDQEEEDCHLIKLLLMNYYKFFCNIESKGRLAF